MKGIIAVGGMTKCADRWITLFLLAGAVLVQTSTLSARTGALRIEGKPKLLNVDCIVPLNDGGSKSIQRPQDVFITDSNDAHAVSNVVTQTAGAMSDWNGSDSKPLATDFKSMDTSPNRNDLFGTDQLAAFSVGSSQNSLLGDRLAGTGSGMQKVSSASAGINRYLLGSVIFVICLFLGLMAVARAKYSQPGNSWVDNWVWGNSRM
jgi:hypothetical protein